MDRRARQPLDRGTFLRVAAAVLAAMLPVLPMFPLWLRSLLLLLVALAVGLYLRGLKLPNPVRLPLTLGIAVVAVAGSGFSISHEAGAGLLVAMLAAKLLETRSIRDGRSACSFSLLALMAGFLRDQGPLTFLLALLACVLIITALARLARLPLGTAPPAGKPLREMISSTRLLAISLPFAFVLFFLFPRFPGQLWGTLGPDEQARSGLSNSVAPGDIVEMLLDDSPALRVTFEGPPPPVGQMYWRGPVLSRFDGRSWSRWHGVSFATPAQMEIRGEPIRQEVMQEPTAYRYLIGLDVPVEAPEQGRMSGEHTVYSLRPNESVRRFHMTSARDYVLEAELRPGARQAHLGLPAGFNPRTRELMEEWRKENSDPAQLVARALEWFHESFYYSLTPPPLARDSVDDFLFETREGYCEHFASSFAVMMRMAGIPARVVTGYQGGFHNRVGDYWLVRNSDAHAWNEIWLEGRGWVRVDPTAAVAPERIQDGLAAITPPRGALSRFGQPLWDGLDALRRGWNYIIVDFDAARQRALLGHFGLDAEDWRQLGLVLMFAIALTLGLSFFLLWRGAKRKIEDPLLRAWRRCTRTLARAGVGKQRGETVHQFLQRAARCLPDDAAQLQALGQRYVSLRYAGTGETGDPEARKTLMLALRRFRIRTPRSRRVPCTVPRPDSSSRFS